MNDKPIDIKETLMTSQKAKSAIKNNERNYPVKNSIRLRKAAQIAATDKENRAQ